MNFKEVLEKQITNLETLQNTFDSSYGKAIIDFKLNIAEQIRKLVETAASLENGSIMKTETE